MASNEIAFMSAASTAKAVRARELSPTEAVEAYLERIDRLDSRLAAYITVTREEALNAARLVEDKLERGEDAGPPWWTRSGDHFHVLARKPCRNFQGIPISSENYSTRMSIRSSGQIAPMPAPLP